VNSNLAVAGDSLIVTICASESLGPSSGPSAAVSVNDNTQQFSLLSGAGKWCCVSVFVNVDVYVYVYVYYLAVAIYAVCVVAFLYGGMSSCVWIGGSVVIYVVCRVCVSVTVAHQSFPVLTSLGLVRVHVCSFRFVVYGPKRVSLRLQGFADSDGTGAQWLHEGVDQLCRPGGCVWCDV
jgi:hypothetical protein